VTVGYVEGLETAPGGWNDTWGQAEEAVAAAMTAASSAQRDAARFIHENGADVVSGHSDVGEVVGADRGRDLDPYPDASVV
jgi:hypothetical protein